MRLLWEDRAWNDYLYWQMQDKKKLKKINSLIKDIQRNTFEGIGKPEPLKDNLSGTTLEEKTGNDFAKERTEGIASPSFNSPFIIAVFIWIAICS